jgi:hypothetical protein
MKRERPNDLREVEDVTSTLSDYMGRLRRSTKGKRDDDANIDRARTRDKSALVAEAIVDCDCLRPCQ